MEGQPFSSALVTHSMDADTLERSGTHIHVRVVPNAREYSIQYDAWRKELKIKVKAQPRKGKANQEVIMVLSTYFKNPVIVSGRKSRFKTIKVDNPSDEAVTILEEIICTKKC